jgi:regulator of nucleoside diphosphate kinase
MPADVVRIGSIIEFEVDDGRRLKVQLVLPENADINAGRISVLTPVGAALIGLSPGQSMEWSGNDGKERLLTVLAVSKRDGAGNLFAQASI